MSNNVEKQKQESLKTLSHINRLPIVNSACMTAVSYYNTLKNTHSLVRMSCNVAEYSYNVAITVASPVLFYVCGKPSKKHYFTLYKNMLLKFLWIF